MEIKIVNKAVEVEREWKVGDVFQTHDDIRMIIYHNNNKVYGLDLKSGVVTSSGYDSPNELVDSVYDTGNNRRMKTILILTEE